MVDASFCASYVSMIAAANMGGRIFWSSSSDLIGRKNTCKQAPWHRLCHHLDAVRTVRFCSKCLAPDALTLESVSPADRVFFGLGAPLYCSLPMTAEWMGAGDATAPVALGAFYGSSLLIFTMYGGGFATIPAYLADIFGTSHVGGIHGRLLTAWSAAGIAGPATVTALRRSANDDAIAELTAAVDPTVFAATFGAHRTP